MGSVVKSIGIERGGTIRDLEAARPEPEISGEIA
jgi:hypothetical protein